VPSTRARLGRPTLSAIGSLGAALTLLCSCSFLFTTPGQSTELSGFLMKDLFLFGAALWSAGEALEARARRTPDPAGAHHLWNPA
jgi:hypothetical protein